MRKIDELSRGFKLIQDDRFFKLGQDSVLLKYFSNIKKYDKILDMGCGNGAISVMLCANFPNIRVVGIEIQHELCDIAKENVEINNLLDRLEIINDDVQNINKYYKMGHFDYVITNPPYFAPNTGKMCVSDSLNISRHEDVDFIKCAAAALRFGGKFSMVNRSVCFSNIICRLSDNNLQPKRIRFIHKNIQSESNCFLVEAQLGAKPGIIVEPPLILYDMLGNKTSELEGIYSGG